MNTRQWQLLLAYFLIRDATASPVALAPRTITAPCAAGETTMCDPTTAYPTIETGVVNGATVTETFYPTSFSDLASITSETTITTQDASGATVLAIVGAAGVGYLVYEGAVAGGIIQLQPPPLPTFPEFTFDPTTTATSAEPTPTDDPNQDDPDIDEEQPRLVYTNTDPVEVIITVPYDVRACNGVSNSEDEEFQLTQALTTITEFCANNANTVIGSEGLTEAFSLDAGKEFNVSVTLLPLGCDETSGATTLTQDNCNWWLQDAVNGCETDSNTVKHGGTVQNGCLQYSIMGQASPGALQCTATDLPSLPGLPGASSDTIKYATTTGLQPDEAKANIDAFCANITAGSDDGYDMIPGSPARIYYNPSRSNTQMRIQLDYSDQVECPQSGDNAKYHTTQGSCTRLLNRIIDDCSTGPEQGYGKFGGTLTDACGVFGIQTANVEPIKCNTDGRTADSATVAAAINQFCTDGLYLDPNRAPLQSDAFYNNAPDGYAWSNYIDNSNNQVVKVSADWGNLVQNSGCQVDKTRFAISGSECTRRLNDIFGQCSQGGVLGAQQQEGCVLWSMSYTSTTN